MPRTLVWDLDGTLVDSVDDLTSALNNVLRPRGLAPFARAEVTPMIGNGVHVLLTKAFAARDATLDHAVVEEFMADYTPNSAVLTRPFPGVVDAMQAMTGAGWTFAVCTNKPEAAARALLAELRLDPWFTAVGGGDSFPTRKPDPAHLLATIAAAGGEPGRAVMVGDHSNDVIAAMGAHVPCIFAAWGYGPPAMAAGSAGLAIRASDLPRLCDELVPA